MADLEPIHRHLARRTAVRQEDRLRQNVRDTALYMGDAFSDPDVVQLYNANPLSGAPDFAKRKLVELQSTSDDNYYTAPLGDLDLLIAASLLYQAEGIQDTTLDNLVVTAGAGNAVSAAAYALINPDDIIVAPVPTYTLFADNVATFEGQLRPIQLDKETFYSLDPDAFREQIKRMNDELMANWSPGRNGDEPPRVKAVLLITPNNSDGRVHTEEEFRKLLPVIEEFDLMVIHDRLYSGIPLDENLEQFDFAEIPEMRDRTIMIDAVSKKFGATQWRVGFAAAPPLVAERMRDFVRAALWSVPTSYQKASAVMLLASIPEGTEQSDALHAYIKGDHKPLLSLIAPEGSQYHEMVERHLMHSTQHEHLTELFRDSFANRQKMRNYMEGNNIEYTLRKDLMHLLVNGRKWFDDEGPGEARRQQVLRYFAPYFEKSGLTPARQEKLQQLRTRVSTEYDQEEIRIEELTEYIDTAGLARLQEGIPGVTTFINPNGGYFMLWEFSDDVFRHLAPLAEEMGLNPELTLVRLLYTHVGADEYAPTGKRGAPMLPPGELGLNDNDRLYRVTFAIPPEELIYVSKTVRELTEILINDPDTTREYVADVAAYIEQQMSEKHPDISKENRAL